MGGSELMKRLVLLGFLLAVTAVPCRGGGMDDFIAAGGRWDAGNREDALDLYQKAIASGELSDADMLDAHYNSAVLYYMLQELKPAMLEIDRVLETSPDHISAIGLRASVWMAVGKKYGVYTGDNALADWERVLELDPADATTYNDRAMFYVEKNEYAKAIDDLEKFLALEPDNPDHRYLLEQLKGSLAKQGDTAAEQ
jgi:tetratricopeptide (TPR) repeat protein